MDREIGLRNNTDVTIEFVTTHHKVAPGETITIDEGVLKANGPWMAGALHRGWLVDPVEDDAPEHEVQPDAKAVAATPMTLTRSAIDKMQHEDLDDYLMFHGLTMPDDGLVTKRKALKRAVFLDDD